MLVKIVNNNNEKLLVYLSINIIYINPINPLLKKKIQNFVTII